MPQPQSLTRHIGLAERSLRALLERELAAARFSFAQWTTLVALDERELPTEDVVGRQLAGHVTTAGGAALAIDSLVASGDIAGTSGADGAHVLALTADGRRRFSALRDTVARLADELHRGIPEADLEATRRTLVDLAGRAEHLRQHR